MLYICVPAQNDARTVGLLLWKIRQVFSEHPREYHLLVANDGSSDDTAEVLEKYQHALPLTVIDHPEPRGRAATLEAMLRRALHLTDRPKRDCAITLPADFAVSPVVLPEMVRRFESGADVVIGEALAASASLAGRLVRRAAGWLLRPGLHVPGVRDILSGVMAIRLVTLNRCFRESPGALLRTQGRCANAELVARAAAHARQIAVVPFPPAARGPSTGHEERAFPLAVALFRAGRLLSSPEPESVSQRGS